MKDYFDDSMHQYVSQTVTSTIESSVNPLATQLSDMTTKFSSFCDQVTKALADKQGRSPQGPTIDPQVDPQVDSEDDDFLDVATEGYLSLNEDLTTLSDGEIPREKVQPDASSAELITFKVLSDKGLVQFQVDLSDPEAPIIPFKQRVELMANLAGETCEATTDTQVPGAAHWFVKKSATIKDKSTLHVPLQFAHQVKKSLDTIKNLSKRKTFPKPPKPSTVAIVQDNWNSTRIPTREFNKLCYKDCVPRLPANLDHVKVTPIQLSELEACIRDTVACVTYIMRITQSIGALQDHFCKEEQDIQALQIAITSLLDLQVGVTDHLHKDLVFLFTSITLMRRDLYMGALHSSIASSTSAVADLRHASMGGDYLFGESEETIVKDILGYTGEVIKIRRSSPRKHSPTRDRRPSFPSRGKPDYRRRPDQSTIRRTAEPRRPFRSDPPSSGGKPFSSTRPSRGRGRGGQKR
jgi:hypothetical protein